MAHALPALLAWLAGCALLVDGTLNEVHCSIEGASGPPACPIGLTCWSGLCVTERLGIPCTRDQDCAQGDLCLAPSTLGEEGTPHCSRPCCASIDCGDDPRFVCWNARTGAGSFCRDARTIGRTPGGSRRALDPCDTSGDCRSGLCDQGRCADTCCSNAACAAGQGNCVWGAGPNGQLHGFWCSASSGGASQPRYAPCSHDQECASGLCMAFQPGEVRRCSAPCCSSAECEVATALDKGRKGACMAVQVDGVWMRACDTLVLDSAEGGLGSTCQHASDCRSGDCENQRCTDVCCTDASCGDPSSFACRPTDTAGAWALHCVPRF